MKRAIIIAAMLAATGLAGAQMFAQLFGATGTPIPALAWYKLDGNALDSSGNGYDGTWVGTEAYTNGGAYFDGNSRIIVNSTVGNIAPNGSLTVSLWARDVETDKNNTVIEGLVSKVRDVNNARPGWGFYKRSSYGGLFSRHSQGINTYYCNLFISNRSLEVWNGTWRHLAIVYDPTTGRSYGFYNGALTEGSGLWPVADGMSNDKNLTLGATSGGSGTSVGMSLKDVRIYSRVLSPANIKRIMESQDNEPLEELQ